MTAQEALARLSPATLRAWSAALALKREKGRLPSPTALWNLARAEGACPWALGVLVRHALPRMEKRHTTLTRLDRTREEVWVPSVEAAHAIIATGRPVTAKLMCTHVRELPTGTPYTFHPFTLVDSRGREVGARARASHP